jgi:hypothetical protein
LQPFPRVVERFEGKRTGARADAKYCRQGLEQRIELLVRLQIATDETG